MKFVQKELNTVHISCQEIAAVLFEIRSRAGKTRWSGGHCLGQDKIGFPFGMDMGFSGTRSRPSSAPATKKIELGINYGGSGGKGVGSKDGNSRS